MVAMNSYAHGQFCWVDLMSKDMQAAKPFYNHVLGWNAVDQDTHGGPPYSLFELNQQQIAGLGQMTDEMKSSGMPPVWNSYVNVDDVQSTTDKAASLGAAVTLPPMQIPGAGHMSIIGDPSGAHLSFWQKANHGGAQYVNDPGGWVWNELVTAEPDKSINFYADLFGWTFEKEDTSENNYWIIKNGSRMNGGIMEKPAEMREIPPHWSVYFAVEDIKVAGEQVKNAGGTILKDPIQVSSGHICVISDPQGACAQLIQMSVPVDQ